LPRKIIKKYDIKQDDDLKIMEIIDGFILQLSSLF